MESVHMGTHTCKESMCRGQKVLQVKLVVKAHTQGKLWPPLHWESWEANIVLFCLLPGRCHSELISSICLRICCLEWRHRPLHSERGGSSLLHSRLRLSLAHSTDKFHKYVSNERLSETNRCQTESFGETACFSAYAGREKEVQLAHQLAVKVPSVS